MSNSYWIHIDIDYNNNNKKNHINFVVNFKEYSDYNIEEKTSQPSTLNYTTK